MVDSDACGLAAAADSGAAEGAVATIGAGQAVVGTAQVTIRCRRCIRGPQWPPCPRIPEVAVKAVRSAIEWSIEIPFVVVVLGKVRAIAIAPPRPWSVWSGREGEL